MAGAPTQEPAAPASSAAPPAPAPSAPPAAVPSAPPAPPAPSDRRSALHDEHVALGAKLVPFGGWEMPLSYPSGTVAEHRACREAAVVFDVSHLGTVVVEGPEAEDCLQRSLSNDLRRIAPGRAQYTHLLDEDGGVTDDIIVWWVSPDRFDVMPNASNTGGVRAALGGRDTTAERVVLAVQGPEARRRLAQVVPEAAEVGRFRVHEVKWHGMPLRVAGTGYTGEDGVECAVPATEAASLWRALLGAGITPAGLGARDTLRLEAGLPLHGHELGPGITPLQAGLAWVVGWDKAEFRGRDALVEERRVGPRRRLRGLVTAGRRPPRAEAVVRQGDREVGQVTSGNFSPMRECGIALAFIQTAAEVADGDELVVAVRGATLDAQVVRPPFWPLRAGS